MVNNADLPFFAKLRCVKQVCQCVMLTSDTLYLWGKKKKKSGKIGEICCVPGHVLNVLFLAIKEEEDRFLLVCWVFFECNISGDKCILCHYMRIADKPGG